MQGIAEEAFQARPCGVPSIGCLLANATVTISVKVDNNRGRARISYAERLEIPNYNSPQDCSHINRMPQLCNNSVAI